MEELNVNEVLNQIEKLSNEDQVKPLLDLFQSFGDDPSNHLKNRLRGRIVQAIIYNFSTAELKELYSLMTDAEKDFAFSVAICAEPIEKETIKFFLQSGHAVEAIHYNSLLINQQYELLAKLMPFIPAGEKILVRDKHKKGVAEFRHVPTFLEDLIEDLFFERITEAQIVEKLAKLPNMTPEKIEAAIAKLLPF